jgi:hypothetical protein
VNGLGAGGVIIQNDDFALACPDLFANERKEILLRPFRREVTKQVFFVDGLDPRCRVDDPILSFS